MEARKWAMRGGLVVAGVLAGLALTELAFYLRDDGAFPHVNLYAADAELGARLRPNHSQRIAFAGNPVTSLRTNASGYRGADWPDPAPDAEPGEILVVGDSQVFGLGVEEDQTASAQLGEITGRTVLNGGVPTYGPEEYLAVVEEVLEAREGAIDDVVIVVNFSNDLFELERPNRERHGVWDGWAVRIESMPESVTAFPGRELLYRQSHAFFALRKWWASGSELSTISLPSEGGIGDLVVEGRELERERSKAAAQVVESRKEATRRQREFAAILRDPAKDAMNAQHYAHYIEPLDDTDTVALREKAVQATGEALSMSPRDLRETSSPQETNRLARKAWLFGAQPGDIVHAEYAEASRPVPVTAELLALGAREAKDLRARMMASEALRERLGAPDPDTIRPDPTAIDPSNSTWVTPERRSWSPLEPWLLRARDVVESHGAELTVVALPLDVQVLESQWDKYGVEPIDMTPSLLLLEDLADAGRRSGVRVVQPREALAAVGDGAWLDGDLHLSADGQRALAERVASGLDAELPLALPGPGLPEGRSFPPVAREWVAVDENYVRHSTPEHCQTRRVREWLRVDCRDQDGIEHTGLDLSGASLEAFGLYLEGRGATAFLPLLPGVDQDVIFLRNRHPATLEVRWKEDGEVDLGLERRGAEGTVSAGIMATRPGLFLSESPLPIPSPTTSSGDELGVFLEGTPHLARWMGHAPLRCAPVLDASAYKYENCVLDATSVDLPCEEGTARAGGAGHCAPLCGPDVPCEAGTCTDWQGGRVCL